MSSKSGIVLGPSISQATVFVNSNLDQGSTKLLDPSLSLEHVGHIILRPLRMEMLTTDVASAPTRMDPPLCYIPQSSTAPRARVQVNSAVSNRAMQTQL